MFKPVRFEGDVEELRTAFGVDPEIHERLLAEIRSESGILLGRVRGHR